MPTRSYTSSEVGHCMGERDEETSDVPGNPGNNDGNGFRPSAQLEKYLYSSSAHAMIRSDPELPRRSEI